MTSATPRSPRKAPVTIFSCFLGQQAAEKAVKAFLVLHGEEEVWGHSVAVLCDRAGGYEPAFVQLRPNGAALDRHYIPTRYPNGLPGGLPADAFGTRDSEQALEDAGAILEEVEKAFGEG